jgi:hypothetical protein
MRFKTLKLLGLILSLSKDEAKNSGFQHPTSAAQRLAQSD